MTSGGWAQDPTDRDDEERDATSWSGPGPHTRRDFFIAVFGTPLLIATTWLIGYAVAAPTGETRSYALPLVVILGLPVLLLLATPALTWPDRPTALTGSAILVIIGCLLLVGFYFIGLPGYGSSEGFPNPPLVLLVMTAGAFVSLIPAGYLAFKIPSYSQLAI